MMRPDRDVDISTDLTIKIQEAKTNLLKGWSRFEWCFFFIVIPAILLLIYVLPQGMKDTYFILNTTQVGNIPAYFTTEYTHSQVFHLFDNLVVFLIVMLLIFALETNKKRFWIMAGSSLCIVPFVSSILTIELFRSIGISGITQGFSATASSLMAYLMILIAVWLLGDALKDFDHPERNAGSKLLFYVSCGLLTVILAAIVVGGINLGMFTTVGSQTTNGIAHFGGFMTGLIVFLVYDAATEMRRFFQITFGIAIIMGLLWYRQYILLLMQLPRGG